MFATILSAILAFFKAIPIFDRWFTKTGAEKSDEIDKRVNDDASAIEKDGRPKWE